MKSYMMTIDVPPQKKYFLKERVDEISAEITRLMEEDKVRDISVDEAMENIWMTVYAENDRAAIEVLTEIPVVRHFDFDMRPLAFQQSARQMMMPQMSLN